MSDLTAKIHWYEFCTVWFFIGLSEQLKCQCFSCRMKIGKHYKYE